MNIKFEKVWIDGNEPFCEIGYNINSDSVSLKSKFYVMDCKLDELASKLALFANGLDPECYWSNSIDSSSPDISIKAFRIDKAGHIRFEVFAIVDDIKSHSCCFFINGLETEMLLRFCKKLKNLQLNGTAFMVEE